LRNRELDRLYERLSEEGKEAADYIDETRKERSALSDEEWQATFGGALGWAAAMLERLSTEARSLVTEISWLKARMYYARAEEFTD
jgi:hypothetical protein